MSENGRWASAPSRTGWLVVAALLSLVGAPGCTSDTDAGANGNCAELSGTIARIRPVAGDGVGDMVVSVMTANPAFDPDNAELVEALVIEGVDMNADGATAEFHVACVPPRDEAYYVNAFFDEDEDAVEVEGPEVGELINVHLDESDQVVMDAPGKYSINIELNFYLPENVPGA